MQQPLLCTTRLDRNIIILDGVTQTEEEMSMNAMNTTVNDESLDKALDRLSTAGRAYICAMCLNGIQPGDNYESRAIFHYSGVTGTSTICEACSDDDVVQHVERMFGVNDSGPDYDEAYRWVADVTDHPSLFRHDAVEAAERFLARRRVADRG